MRLDGVHAMLLGAVMLLVAGGCREGAAPPVGPASAAVTRTVSMGPVQALKLLDHPLLTDPKLALGPTSCQLPAWQDSSAAEQVFLAAALRCLNTAWESVLEQAGLPFVNAGLRVHVGQSYDTECGSRRSSASLCETTIHILYPQQGWAALSSDAGSSLGLIAGWYAEYVQGQSGVAAAYQATSAGLAKGSAERGEFSRRYALQWQCFSGAFIHSQVGHGDITQQMQDQALAAASAYGDDAGEVSVNATAQSHRCWFQRGAAAASLMGCNTWAAPSEDVY